MSMMRPGLGWAEFAGLLAVERALVELRAGRPVVLVCDGRRELVVAVDGLDEDALEGLGRARLVLSGPRLKHLGHGGAAGALCIPEPDMARILRLAADPAARLDAPVAPPLPGDAAALELARLAYLLPAVLVSGAPETPSPWLTVQAADIMSYADAGDRDLRIISRAPVPLEGAADSEFVIFRGGQGLREQVAVIIGKPDFARPVRVRLHSACLTGDLFGSLKCDCGDQLRGTARAMSQAGGGILLYLDQEGRAHGLSGKMRAYRLQAQGLDTYDADETLGFEHDSRRFAFAARMLRMLGATRVRVLTNNPEKIAALRDAGLEVTADERIEGRRTVENTRYLETKRDRAGHLVSLETRAANARPAE